MGIIFDFLGSIFGYILWFFYDAVSNYAIAITLFTLLINIIMFPLAIKRQKAMAKNARLAEKQKDLQKRYGKDRQKYNEELTKLYQQEGTSPFGGCFSAMLLPLILWGGIFGAITKPMQNTLHIPQEKIVQATKAVSEVPELADKLHSGYEQLQLVRMFDTIKPHLTMLNEKEFSDLEEYSSGFNLLGINLLNRPNASSFQEMLWIIPLLSFAVSAFSMYITQKTSGNSIQAQGTMKAMPYIMFLFPAYIAYTIPAAVGLYWILNALVGMFQSIILNKYYNVYTLNAKDEFVRFSEIKNFDSTVEQIKNPDEIIYYDENIIPISANRKKSKNKK